MNGAPDAQRLPAPEPAPARHAATAPQLDRQVAPAQAMPQNEDDAPEGGAVRHARTATPRVRLSGWQPPLDCFPQFVADQCVVCHKEALRHTRRPGLETSS